jgi:hypothetical protein
VLVSVIALAAAVRAVPGAPAGRTASLDVVGAGLLAAGLCCVLVVLSETSVWHAHLALAVAVSVFGAALLGCWALWSLRAAAPLVDMRLLRYRAVVGANLSMLVGGMGMYLLLILLTRYLQTPAAAGYGFGLSAFWAGLALVPFSALGFVAGKAVPGFVRSSRFGGAAGAATLSALVVAAAFALFAVARSALPEVLLAMAVLGFGVGGFSAAMPSVILAVTPAGETSSAMSFNQVVRAVGFSAGSAVGGLVLAAGTAGGSLSPADGAYTTAAWLGAGVMVAAAMCWWIVGTRG